MILPLIQPNMFPCLDSALMTFLRKPDNLIMSCHDVETP